MAVLDSPLSSPLVSFLPGMLQDDDLVARLCSGIDRMVAPISSTLDNFNAYLDVATTTPELVRWLGTWLGVTVDESWSIEQQRRAVEEASQVFGRRGTVGGLLDELALYAEGDWEVEESGGCTWSLTPGTAVPGTDNPTVAVRVTVADPAAIDGERLDALITQASPAHLRLELEVRSSS